MDTAAAPGTSCRSAVVIYLVHHLVDQARFTAARGTYPSRQFFDLRDHQVVLRGRPLTFGDAGPGALTQRWACGAYETESAALLAMEMFGEIVRPAPDGPTAGGVRYFLSAPLLVDSVRRGDLLALFASPGAAAIHLAAVYRAAAESNADEVGVVLESGAHLVCGAAMLQHNAVPLRIRDPDLLIYPPENHAALQQDVKSGRFGAAFARARANHIKICPPIFHTIAPSVPASRQSAAGGP